MAFPILPRPRVVASFGVTAGLLTVAAAPPAHAQSLRVGGGVAAPLEPSAFTDLYSLGFHGGLELMDTVGKSKRTALGFAVYHHRFAIDTEGVRDQWRAQGVPNDVPYEIHGGTFVATEAYFYARYAFARSGASPFLLGGAGAGITDATKLTVRLGDTTKETDAKANVDPMMTIGLGIDIPLGPVKLFGQARVSLILTDGDNTIMTPITVGVGF